MKISKLFFICVVLLLAGCDATMESPDNEPQVPGFEFSEQDIVKGRMRIKLKEEPAGEVALRSIGGTTTTGIRALDSSAATLGITHIERTFPPAGKYEERTRREGLHLWYDVWFSEDQAVTRATGNIAGLDGIEKVTPVVKVVPLTSTQAHKPSGYAGIRNVDYPFNDPDLPRLWNFYNDGSESWMEKGSDIRLLDVWKQYNGHPDIIISLVDGGIDTRHPDLQANLWVNQAEVSGNGRDDDDNGYVDDINGFNFIHGIGAVSPNRHGTHVAGIIAATNNNGIGVSGIAGGDGSPDSGVKLMSCQIFEHPNGNYNYETGTDKANIAAAIKYGADNGAVISQNSWGQVSATGIDPVYQEAIDYFIKYAGCDNDGNQLPDSPMKGGIVLFAAANENTSNPGASAPADYEKVLGVAALGPDFKKAPLSAYGNFIDICAPGGVNRQSQGIWSTSLYELGNYESMAGTSMACPHITGVAALLIQKHGVGKQGFTARQLEEILLNTAYSVDEYNPDYAGLLGFGCVDATAALTYDDLVISDPVTLETRQISGNELVFRVNMEMSGDAVITIINGTGQVVMRKSMTVTRFDRTVIDISKLAAGYYTMQYEINGIKVVENFIKL